MTSAQRVAISPNETTDLGLQVYDTDTESFWYWDGITWQSLKGSIDNATYWKTTGNSDINSTSNFLGTTNEQDLVFKTNSTTRVNVTASGLIGIGTSNPHSNSLVDFNGQVNGSLGIKLPYVSTVNRDLMSSPVKGLQIYNTTTDCIEVYVGSKGWYNPCLQNFSNVKPGNILGFTCGAASSLGAFYTSVSVIGNTLTLPYTGGDGGTFNNSSFYSTGVTGMVATINSGVLNNGTGTLTFNLSGAPTGSGTATFTIVMFGQTCAINVNVASGGTISSINGAGAVTNPILYAGYSSTGATATLTYSGGNGGPFAGTTISSTGVTGLTATLTAGSFNVGTGSLVYNISGIPNSVGNATFAVSIGGRTTTFNYAVTAYRSCRNYLTINPGASNGIYKIDPDLSGTQFPLVDCQCDMTTDGGGWTLVLNYVHRGGTTPPNSIKSNSFPVISSSTLGDNESSQTQNWGHLGLAAMNALQTFTELRMYAISSDHSRVEHFKTSHAGTITYYRTGVGTASGIQSSFTPLTGHTSSLPATANTFWGGRGNFAMVDFPYFNGYNRHTACSGSYNRWEVDNYPNNAINNTIHRVWVR